MADTEKRNRLIIFYHTLVAIVLLLAGGALLGLGAWLRTNNNSGLLNLDFGDKETSVRGQLYFSAGALALGGFLLLTGLVSLLALGRRMVGATFRVIYVLLALLIAAALGFASFVAASIVRNAADGDVRDAVRAAWLATVAQHPRDVCAIEAHFNCRGFDGADCAPCPTGAERQCPSLPFCATCGNQGGAPSVGCFHKLVDSARSVFRPVAIASGAVAGVVLLDAIATCFL